MYPNSQYARPVSSFRKPAPVIDVDPDGDPKITVCFNAQWLPYIIGALRQLLLQSTWATTDYDTIDLMQARAQLLIALFIEAAEGCVIDMLFDVRQNEENPCTLEKTTDGDTWSAWANLQLCPPDLIIDGGIIKIKRGGVYVPLDGTGGYDERQDGTYTPPWPTGTVPSGQTGQCLAAENIVAFFATSLTQVKQGLDTGVPVSTSMGIIAGTIGFLGFISAGVFAAVGLILAGLLGALGSAGISDMLSDDTLDKFKCALERNCNADGSFTATQFNAAYDAVGADIPGVKGEIIQNWLNGFGPVGLSRQGHANDITTGDCDICAMSQLVYFQPDNSTPIGHFDIEVGQVVDVPFFSARGVYGLVFGWESGDCCDYTIEMVDWFNASGYEACHVAYCAGGDTGYPSGPPGTVDGSSVTLIWSGTPDAIARVTITRIVKG